MLVIKMSNVLAVTNPRPFSYKSKRGDTVSGFEADVQGLGGDGRMARVQFRGQTADIVAEKALRYPVGKPAEIPVYGEMQAGIYSLRAV
jgi:hypothetical protein